MISPLQAHFTTLHYPINQGDSETQRKLPCLSRLTQRTLGFDGFLYAFAGISGLMYFEISTFDFSARSTQPTGLGVLQGVVNCYIKTS